MAQEELTGGTHSDISDLRDGYRQSPKYQNDEVPFETAYCLTEVAKQPDEYDGPTRYCKNRAARMDDGSHAYSCNFHGKNCNASGGLDNLDELSALKHGMYATDEHLEDDFSEEDQKLYDWVMSWAETYGWPSQEEDPSRYDDLHAIAMAKVRNARANEYILSEGELKRQEIYDENGNLLEKDSPHALSEDVRLKRKLITDLKKELGITPKERARMNTDETEANALEQLTEVASAAVLGDPDDDDQEFDPEDDIFEDG